MEARKSHALPMSVDEIVESYRHAKYPQNQIKILAQLNATTPQIILDILSDAGAISGVLSKEDRENALKEATSSSKPYNRKPWTPEEDRRLVELRTDGLTCEEIGKILDRSAAVVGARLKRLKSAYGIMIDKGGASVPKKNIEKHKWTKAEDEALFKLRDEESESFVTIADRLGLPERCVRNRYYYMIHTQKAPSLPARFDDPIATDEQQPAEPVNPPKAAEQPEPQELAAPQTAPLPAPARPRLALRISLTGELYHYELSPDRSACTMVALKEPDALTLDGIQALIGELQEVAEYMGGGRSV